MKGTIRRIESTHNNMRTPSMEGEYAEGPVVGKRFTIFGESLTEGATHRMITTTVVQFVETVGKLTKFITKNSKYELEEEANNGGG